MFNKDFYPTPTNVIEEMLFGISIENKVILEPSAGKGNIVDYLRLHGAKEVIACETESNLRKILCGKCKLISKDFFDVKASDISHCDLIVMNPPFSCDEQHILHAWNIAPNGCHVISLCNASTIEKPNYKVRRELKTIIEAYGTYQNIGNVFSGSERSTDVQIGLIRMFKPSEQATNEFEGFFLDEDEEEVQENGIMQYDLIRDLVNRYVASVRLYDKQLELAVQMNNLTSQFYQSKIAFQCIEDDKPKHRAEYKKDLQKSAWNYIFNKMNMQKYATSNLKKDINKFVEQQQQVPFTMRNIYVMLNIIVGTHSQRMDKALEEVFDKLTTHYHENRWNLEGWKTNSHYLVNKKFILSGMVDSWYSKDYLHLSYGRHSLEVIEDFQKSLCHLTGEDYNDYTNFHSFVNNTLDKEQPNAFPKVYIRREFGTWYDWGFFRFKAFKKGTIHFDFKDEKVWAMFNQIIAKIKGFPLPEKLKK